MISCKQLSKTYRDGNHLALDSLNLSVGTHSIFGFLGPNGAGKTTAIKILTGLMQPTAGEAYVSGEKVVKNSINLRRSIGYLGQEPAMYRWMTGKELLLFVGSIFGLSKKENLSRADILLDMSGLSAFGNKKITTYSGGMVQRLGIAQALVSKPRVLFLDEPTSSLDPIGRKEVLEFIQNLKDETTVFMSTHILSDVERVCTHVGILNKGRLLACDKLENLKSSFSANVCELEFLDSSDISFFLDKLVSDSDLKSKVSDNILSLTLKNPAEDYKQVLKILAASEFDVKRIELTQASLEDIFVELINTSAK